MRALAPSFELPEHLREVVFAQHPLRLGIAQQPHVRARCLLLGIIAQRAGKRDRMRRVDDDELLEALRMLRGEVPGHRAAPVVGDDDGALVPEIPDQLAQVFDQMARVIIRDRGRLVRQIDAARVGRYGLVIAREFFELILPRVPELRPAVHEQHQRAGAGGDVVQAEAVDLGVAVFHALTKFCRVG